MLYNLLACIVTYILTCWYIEWIDIGCMCFIVCMSKVLVKIIMLRRLWVTCLPGCRTHRVPMLGAKVCDGDVYTLCQKTTLCAQSFHSDYLHCLNIKFFYLNQMNEFTTHHCCIYNNGSLCSGVTESRDVDLHVNGTLQAEAGSLM